MYYVIINCPFSSVNDENYVMSLCIDGSDVGVAPAIAALNADSEVFTYKSAVMTDDVIYTYEGTLCGNVVAEDDEMDDWLAPMVTSKLRFSLAVQTFPSWLLQYCADYHAKVIVYKDETIPLVMWRGYLIAQSLNMTVVDDKISCSLIAVDEVAMASHIGLADGLSVLGITSRHMTLLSLFLAYHSLHHYTGVRSGTAPFEGLYTILGLTHTNRLYWWRDMALYGEDSTEITSVLPVLTVNLDKWLKEEHSTWNDVIEAVCRYLGVTFAVGSWGLITNHDGYILSNPVDTPAKGYVYLMSDGSGTINASSMFATLSNPDKVGADFQVTMEPKQYSKVTVTSEPERWGSHTYLSEEHYKPVREGGGVTYGFGDVEDPSEGFTNFTYHKLVYIQPDSDEDDYLTIHPCSKGEGYTMASNGELPYDNLASCDGVTKPGTAQANSLDFITFMEGAVCVRLGDFDYRGVNEDANTTPYFMLLNHMWGTLWPTGWHTMSSQHDADTPWISFRPQGAAEPAHPSDTHYISISMEVMFVRENFGTEVALTAQGAIVTSDKSWLWLPAASISGSPTKMDYSQQAMMMPALSSVYTGFEDENMPCNGIAIWSSVGFDAYLRVGDWYYDGSDWTRVTSGTPPSCRIRLYAQNNEVASIDVTGAKGVRTKNYYYTVCSPFAGDNSTERNGSRRKLVDMSGLAVDGDLELTILGQVSFINTARDGQDSDVPNSIPFILIKDVKIGYTDDAETMDKDIKNELSMEVSGSVTMEEKTTSLEMSTPSVEGFFDNCLLWQGSTKWHNVSAVFHQGSEIDLSACLENSYIRNISGSLVWQNSSNYKHYSISVTEGTSIMVTASSGYIVQYAFLTKDYKTPTTGTSVDWAEGYNNLLSVAKGTSKVLVAPAGAKYLYIYAGHKSSSYPYTPALAAYATTPEQMLLDDQGAQYSAEQTFVEFSTPFGYDDNVRNVGFRVTNLTEIGGTFLPVKRRFDYTLELMRVKAQKLNT